MTRLYGVTVYILFYNTKDNVAMYNERKSEWMTIKNTNLRFLQLK